MSGPTILSSEKDLKLIGEILAALKRRESLPGGAAREDLDRRLVMALGKLERILPERQPRPSGPPPRPIAVAMALTLFSQPHLVATFGRPPSQTDPHRPELAPVLVPMEFLSELLGLARWELEELQSEIDQRVSLMLKQRRLLSWLWTRFGLPNAGVAQLVELLFPGLRNGDISTVGLSRRGGQLYALVDQPRAPSPSSLYLGWIERNLDGAIAPRGTFSARYVDDSLVRNLAQCTGSEAAEVMALLDRAITVIPRAEAKAFLTADRWRSGAYEGLTNLAGGYPRSAELATPLAPLDVPIEGWFRRNDDALVIDNAKALFDSLALDRVTEVTRQLHAHSLAHFLHLSDESLLTHTHEELIRYATGPHLRAALAPLIAWAKAPESAKHLASRLGSDPATAESSLAPLSQSWERHLAETWIGRKGSQPVSVAARLAVQLLRTRHSLAQLWHRDAILGQEHREAALLFAAHYYAEAPIDRLWSSSAGSLAEDPIGSWFWPLWDDILHARDTEPTADATFSF
ncbi:MAG: hypothetical protein EA397_16480 [Deltaproteobacteria bacterium]|nr:MAG: hypothetical protein EA397_16480 [Deltaproteobacteria bacterium]